MSARNDEKIVQADHIGIGLPTAEAVQAFKNALMERGAILDLRSDPKKHKYFLRLNPEDTLALEIFLDNDGTSAHVDYTVKDLNGIREQHGTGVYDYGIPNMLFVDVPDMPSVHPFSIQLGFAIR
jgi:hypothetical protein